MDKLDQQFNHFCRFFKKEMRKQNKRKRKVIKVITPVFNQQRYDKLKLEIQNN